MKEWLKQHAARAAFMTILVASTWYLATASYNSDRDALYENEKKFERDTGLIFKDKHCEQFDLVKICWFKIPTFSPSFGCRHEETAIYRCTTHECTWLEEP